MAHGGIGFSLSKLLVMELKIARSGNEFSFFENSVLKMVKN